MPPEKKEPKYILPCAWCRTDLGIFLDKRGQYYMRCDHCSLLMFGDRGVVGVMRNNRSRVRLGKGTTHRELRELLDG